MPSIKGTETEKNLLKAFAGESQARNRYTYFASVAKKEGYEQISAIFLETADNEKEHAKVFFKYLEGGDTEITASYPAGKIGTTAENLLAAADGEKEEWSELYPTFADVAESEGFADVAESFREIAEVEHVHDMARTDARCRLRLEIQVLHHVRPERDDLADSLRTLGHEQTLPITHSAPAQRPH